jgi:hypothetical protein
MHAAVQPGMRGAAAGTGRLNLTDPSPAFCICVLTTMMSKLTYCCAERGHGHVTVQYPCILSPNLLALHKRPAAPATHHTRRELQSS